MSIAFVKLANLQGKFEQLVWTIIRVLMLWLAGDVKEPTRLSQGVGHEVPGVVVWPLLLK